MKKKGTQILQFARSPYFPHMPVVLLRLGSPPYRGAFALAAHADSGIPFKPACLYGME